MGQLNCFAKDKDSKAHSRKFKNLPKFSIITTERGIAMPIVYPDAAELDITNHAWKCDVYLIPSLETGAEPEITTHEGIGNLGTPMPAWHNLWHYLGRLPAACVGDSALAMLEDLEDTILQIDKAYLGSEWDGSNHVGKWDLNEDFDYHLEQKWTEAAAEVAQYWLAGDWYVNDGRTWVDYAAEMGLDPEIVKGRDWENKVSEASAEFEAEQDQAVTGTYEYMLGLIEDYLDQE